MFGTRTEPTSQSFFLPQTNTNTKHCAAEAHRFTFLFFASFRNSHTEKRHHTQTQRNRCFFRQYASSFGILRHGTRTRRLLILNFYRTQSSNFHGNTAHRTERNALLDDDDFQLLSAHQSGAGWSTLTIHTTIKGRPKQSRHVPNPFRRKHSVQPFSTRARNSERLCKRTT